MSRQVVITGIGGGIGSATADAFEREGWLVAGVDVEAPDTRAGREVRRIDVGGQDAERLLGELYAGLGRIDAVVNAAGVQNTGSAVETGDEEWGRIMNVNVRGALWASRAALPYLEASAGAVVNVSSVHAVATTRGAAAYAASKAALVSLTRSLALEWAPGVRVNCVLPGAIDTPMLAEGVTRGGAQGGADALRELAGRIPLARVGQPAEIARSIVFLADSEQSSFITGQTLIIDGGVLAGLGSA
jgi:NAD(P)-dependent dehydrogenase (short-subunit alcohol dehydrogenase family)